MHIRVSLPVIRVILPVLLLSGAALAQPPRTEVRVPVAPTLKALIADEDTDGDKKITIDDPRLPETMRGDRRFSLHTPDGRLFEVAGTYYFLKCISATTGRCGNQGTTRVTVYWIDAPIL